MDKHQSTPANATTTASIVVSVLAVISVVLRFWTRRLIKAGYGPDDWWILAGLALMLSTGVILLYGICISNSYSSLSDRCRAGVKKDPDGGQDINRDDPHFDFTPHTTYLQTSFIAATLYFSVVTSIKVSILYM